MPFENIGQQSIKTPMLEAKPVLPAGRQKLQLRAIKSGDNLNCRFAKFKKPFYPSFWVACFRNWLAPFAIVQFSIVQSARGFWPFRSQAVLSDFLKKDRPLWH